MTETTTPQEKKPAVTFNDLVILTPNKERCTLSLNTVQETFLDSIVPGWRERTANEEPIPLQGIERTMLLSRRIGMTTLTQALVFMDTVNRPGVRTLVVTHDAETRSRRFDMFRRFYRNLADDKKPRMGYYARQEMYFDEIDSYLRVTDFAELIHDMNCPEEPEETEIPMPIDNLIIGEAAFYQGDTNILDELISRVLPTGFVIVESIANGWDRWFYDRYFSGNVNRVFFPWNTIPWFKYETPADFVLTPEEAEYAKNHNLLPEQTYWRRRKKEALGRLFQQEYPMTDYEAFDAPILSPFESQKEIIASNNRQIQQLRDVLLLLETRMEELLRSVVINGFDEGVFKKIEEAVDQKRQLVSSCQSLMADNEALYDTILKTFKKEVLGVT